MAQIQNVDYQAIPGHARQMRSLGKDLNREEKSAYTSAQNMHNSWYGKRYNELIKQFNNSVSLINEMLQLVVTDIPVTLEKVSNNYSQADRGSNVTSVGGDQPTKLSNIPVINDVGMKFISSQVEATRNSVSNNFKNAKDKMNSISSEFNKVKWSSEAADAFKAKFNSLKANITSNFDEIQQNFTKLMRQAQEDIEKAESSNTVQ